MKFFLIELEYLVPLEKLDHAVPAHREFLQTLYDIGTLLLSGPKEPRNGGMIIAKSISLEKISETMKEDPFAKLGYANYKYTEFHPVKHQTFLKSWLES